MASGASEAAGNAGSTILTCPACATRYRAALREFEGSAGRTVRCANCGHIWYETGPARQVADGDSSIVKAALGRSALDPLALAVPPPPPRLEVPPRVAPPRPPAPRRGWTWAIWLVAIAAVAAAAAAARPEITALWHSAVGFAASIGHPGSSDSDLAIRKITPSRTGDGLVVDGEIANLAKSPRDVPRLRVTLRDTSEREVQSTIVDPPKTRLDPGEVVHFTTPFPHPPAEATGVVVIFAAS